MGNVNGRQQEKNVQKIQQVYGFTQPDSEALLMHAAQVQTTDVIPLAELNKYVKIDSTTTTLNNLHEGNTSAILDRDGPR